MPTLSAGCFHFHGFCLCISAYYCIFPCNFQFLRAPYMLGIFLYIFPFNSQMERKQMLTSFSFFDHASPCFCVKKILRFKRQMKDNEKIYFKKALRVVSEKASSVVRENEGSDGHMVYVYVTLGYM